MTPLLLDINIYLLPMVFKIFFRFTIDCQSQSKMVSLCYTIHYTSNDMRSLNT